MASRTRKEDSARFKISGGHYNIPSSERDRALLLAGAWPRETEKTLGDGWKAEGGRLFRLITVHNEDGSMGKGARSHKLWEALLQFPNSPLYATHRHRKQAFEFTERWPNLHTMRIVGYGNNPPSQVKHVYLLHNGLNETTDLMFHYRLAAWILDKRRDAVCIIRPLPGHLTRFPFDSPYAELPLDTYLRDPADLFRQFLRYMQETQWLLSVLVPRPHYDVIAGTSLLSEAIPRGANPRAAGRAYPVTLSQAITTEWWTAFRHDMSVEKKKRFKATHSKQPLTKTIVEAAIIELRGLLNWKATLSSSAPKYTASSRRYAPERPCIHVVGYSMGGFMAQSAFFAWPFAISSCTNLFAGGALRDLAPTAFSHPEEWQAVLHGMRYELDRAFREGYLNTTRGRVVGISEDNFGYFTRILYEVFLQYYRGGYASRVAEFSRRLLFIVGGDDPIVRTKNVLDAGPSQGMTLLQIADVSHFPSGRPRPTKTSETPEDEQRRYWLPEVGRIVANFSEQSEGLLHRTLAECWGMSRDPRNKNAGEESDASLESDAAAIANPEQLTERDPTMLASTAFASELRELIACSQSKGTGKKAINGWLLVSRNELSPVFLGSAAFGLYAQAIHHAEAQIARYIKILRRRLEDLTTERDRVSMLIPKESRRMFVSRANRQTFFSKSETPSASRIPSEKELKGMWDFFKTEWIGKGAVGMVTANEYTPAELAPIGPVEKKRLGIDTLSLTVLPDVWIALSGNVIETIRGEQTHGETREINERTIVNWATGLFEEKSERDKPSTLKEWIDAGDVLAVTVSGAELNPRYRGHRLLEEKDVIKAIVHWSLAYCASTLSGGSWTPSTA
jgi:hypothetical protein